MATVSVEEESLDLSTCSFGTLRQGYTSQSSFLVLTRTVFTAPRFTYLFDTYFFLFPTSKQGLLSFTLGYGSCSSHATQLPCL